MHSSPNFQIEAATPWEDLGNGISRQVFGYGDTLMLVKVRFEKGAVGAVHQHQHVQASYVESGRFEATISGQTQVLTKGDGFYVQPHEWHGVVCLEAGTLVDAFSPVREDFLPAGRS